MSSDYDKYLENHIANVKRSFEWIKKNIPLEDNVLSKAEWLVDNHDRSKYDPEEYEAYDNYFYGRSRSYSVVRDFNRAWLHHIHKNPHHWQHWVLIHDEPEEADTAIDMSREYIIEMICDWWSFSWNTGNLYEIFDWYEKHKDYIFVSDETNQYMQYLLNAIKEKLEESNETA